MMPIENVKRLKPDIELEKVLQAMNCDGVNQLPVMTNGHIDRMLSREDVGSYLRTLKEFGV